MAKMNSSIKAYYLVSVFSVIFAVVGFSYNAWRLEVSEDNNNIRTAAFAVIQELAELEQVIFAAHYDQDEVQGSPRKGWVKVGLIVDLSLLISTNTHNKALRLKASWKDNWSELKTNEAAVKVLIGDIDDVRIEIKQVIKSLK